MRKREENERVPQASTSSTARLCGCLRTYLRWRQRRSRSTDVILLRARNQRIKIVHVFLLLYMITNVIYTSMSLRWMELTHSRVFSPTPNEFHLLLSPLLSCFSHQNLELIDRLRRVKTETRRLDSEELSCEA
jgi:hypothetical protein